MQWRYLRPTAAVAYITVFKTMHTWIDAGLFRTAYERLEGLPIGSTSHTSGPLGNETRSLLCGQSPMRHRTDRRSDACDRSCKVLRSRRVGVAQHGVVRAVRAGRRPYLAGAPLQGPVQTLRVRKTSFCLDKVNETDR